MPESVGRVRAQAQIALLDMLPDGLTRRVDAVERLGLKGSRRQMLIEWGILVQDAGKLDDAKAERIRQILSRLPGARVDLEVLYVGEDRGALRARGIVAHASTTAADSNPFGQRAHADHHRPRDLRGDPDLALLAVKRATDNRGELRLQAERDATAAQSDPGRLLGKPRAPSVDSRRLVGRAAPLARRTAGRRSRVRARHLRPARERRAPLRRDRRARVVPRRRRSRSDAKPTRVVSPWSSARAAAPPRRP